MSDALFADCVEQAVAMGLRRFQLTPLTGDVFMDKTLLKKLDFLDSHPDVASYEFFTNFTLPDEAKIEHLFRLQKLSFLTVSIYGHDLDSFVAITRSEPKVYRRLLRNLECLLERVSERSFKLEFGLRSYRRIPAGAATDLLRLLDRFKAAGLRVRMSRKYNNWGGYVSNEDVKGLDIDITSDDAYYKKGACTLLFTDVQVMATGVVNACACRDVDATLKIGDLREQPLREILSTRNAAYMQIIREQQRGAYRPICRSCDFYKSIYRKRSGYWKGDVPVLNLRETLENLDSRE
jgi:hypothetical protein